MLRRWTFGNRNRGEAVEALKTQAARTENPDWCTFRALSAWICS